MKLNRSWPRIIGVHAEDNGDIAAIWLAHDRDTDRVYLYDSAVLKREVFAVIANRLNGSENIPIAWEQSAEEIAKKLREKPYKCKTLSEGYKESPAVADVNAREIWERIRAKRFMVGNSNTEWFAERKRFSYLEGGKVPQEGFPLMSATRHAVNQLKRAKTQEPDRKPIKYDNAGII